MNIDVNWHNEEQTIVYYDFNKGWEWIELTEAFAQAEALVSQVHYKVDVIMDFRSSWAAIPKGAISQARQPFASKPHPNINNTVLVGNQFVKSLTDLVRKFVPSSADNWKLFFAASLAEAYSIIETQRGKDEVHHE